MCQYHDDNATVELCTVPLSASGEILKMREAGILPKAMAVERALFAIGASKSQVSKALADVAAEEAAKEAQRDDKETRAASAADGE